LFGCRFAPVKSEHIEILKVEVSLILNGGNGQKLVASSVVGKRKCNSWYYVEFNKKVFVPKGAECVITVHSPCNAFQRIPISVIRKNIDNATKCATFSKFEVFLFDENAFYRQSDAKQSLQNVTAHNCFSIKSLSVALIDECNSTKTVKNNHFESLALFFGLNLLAFQIFSIL